MKHTRHSSLLYNIPFKIFLLLTSIILVSSCNDKVTVDNEAVAVVNTNEYTEIPAPVKLSPDIPVDVSPNLQNKLKKAGNIYKLNEKFNEYSWQAFIAIMWPRDNQGNPATKFTDNGDPTWLGWKEAFQVYRADGKKPAPWGSPRSASGLGLSSTILNDSDARVVLSSHTPTHASNFDIADEVDQAFAGKLFDQNGNVVVYEVLMNKEEFDYVVDSTLYNINGQLKFSKNNSEANFPKGDYEKNELGAVEIKFAWKILEDSDIKDRYYREEGYIIGPDSTLVKKDLGMIGFHISQKTPTGKQWVWSTFEHIDNLDQNVIEKNGETVVIPPSLTDPNCEICPVNIDVTNAASYKHETDSHGNYWLVSVSNGKGKDSTKTKYYAESDVMKTQAKRMVDIPIRVQRINEKMQQYLKQQKSVWQYYQLIDTQYPLDQNVPPGPNKKSNYKIPESVVNKPGGHPNLDLLTNITMETFFQKGNQDAANLIENANYQTNVSIFGTESCMGCHSSAGIYNSYAIKNGIVTFNTGVQLTGDFSWLLQKAQWEKGIPKPTK